MDQYKLRNALEALAEIDATMPMSYALTLVWAYINNGQHQSDLEAYLKTSTATASRAVQWWSEWRSFKDKKRGPGFLESYPDPIDKRYRTVHVTKAGQKFMQELLEKTNG